MKPAPFVHLSAGSIDEAVALLLEHGDDVKILAGGQSLVPLMNMRLAQPAVLVDIGRTPGLDAIAVDGALRIGATARQSAVLRSPAVAAAAPLLTDALQWVSHPAIRNRGTFGGSVAHADAAAELPSALLALDAEMVARGPQGERTIPAGDFFVTYFTSALEEDEVLTEVRVPPRSPAERTGAKFLEIARRHGDFALVGVAVSLSLDAEDAIAGARVALCGVADVPLRARAAEAALVGTRAGDVAAATEAGRLAAEGLEPPSDVHASARYRVDAATTLVRRALLAASPTAPGGER
ncbi:MAG: FAD binding domain-containing protein [Actinobacteria bacterium]|nr:FAD binding domain-containing protein [Actinomycetota bacterium]